MTPRGTIRAATYLERDCLVSARTWHPCTGTAPAGTNEQLYVLGRAEGCNISST